MIGWLTWRIGALILAGGLAAAVIDGIGRRAEIASLERGNVKLAGWLGDAQKSVGTCTANVATLKGAVDVQSADIRKLADASQAATAKAAKAASDIAKDAKAAREASQRVLARPIPTADTACVEAARLLRGGT